MPAQRLFDLLHEHHQKHVERATAAAILRDKVAVLSKNLSAYKRHFGPLPDHVAAKLPSVHDVDADWSGEMTDFQQKLRDHE